MTCPHCGNDNTRPSRNKSWMDRFNDWSGRTRYRCRDCRASFYARLSQSDLQKLKESEAIRKKRRKGWRGFVQSPTQRRTLEALVFFGMLLVFYLAFSGLVKKDGSGMLSRPTTETQP
ncbi:MAG: hypothetical protein WB676_23960 [Bryobacteraceae bacterium]